MKSQIESALSKTKIVSIIRGVSQKDILNTVSALHDGGITLMEITLNTKNALEMISQVRAEFLDIHIGAGTVMTLDACKSAIAAGATYIVTPHTNVDIIRHCAANGILIFSGAMTPTEVAIAIGAGADYIKLFPAASLGLQYFKEIQGPFSGTKFVPVGGITTKNAADFLRASAVGLGVGGYLCDLKLIAEGDFAAITARCREFCAAL